MESVALAGFELDKTALAVFSGSAGYFTERVRARVHAYAAHASVALTAAVARDSTRNLEQALKTNRTIGTAVGVLMTRLRIREREAFELLQATSQRQHVKLLEVAEAVVLTGGLPGPPAG